MSLFASLRSRGLEVGSALNSPWLVKGNNITAPRIVRLRRIECKGYGSF